MLSFVFKSNCKLQKHLTVPLHKICMYIRLLFEFLPYHCNLEISLALRCYGNSAPLSWWRVNMCVSVCAVVPKQKGQKHDYWNDWRDEIIYKMVPVFTQVPGTLFFSCCGQLFVCILQGTHCARLMETLRLLTALQQWGGCINLSNKVSSL